MERKSIYERCKVWWWSGYYVKVRDSLNYHHVKRHLSDVEKEIYEKEFGDTILMDSDFENWYYKLKKDAA